MQFFIGFSLGILISVVAWKLGTLSTSGAVAAAISGGLIFSAGGLQWALPLLAFFISSSALSRVFKKRKAGLHEKFAKGDRRDAGQVLANSGIGAVLAIVLILSGTEGAISGWVWIAYLGAMATVNADTWATEIGVLNPKPPRLITTGQSVEPGTSGGISQYGTLATIGGAALIGLLGLAYALGAGPLPPMLAATLGGVCGALFDSLLGATVQAIYHCPQCDKDTERHPTHTCGVETIQIRGWVWLNNDWVNFIASVVGAGLALGIWGLLG
jgi:uncharacterized protein (TIGR00297 family)